jgi:uncharacterized protein YjiS (DUF1127 family)
MMTQPIQNFQSLTSETAPAGGNDLSKLGFAHDDRRVLERRARYERAAMLANVLTDAVLWLGRQVRRAVGAIKAGRKLRAAEAQLYRMSDRELADLGLCRSEIPFAIRQPSGVSPEFGGVTGAADAANQNLRHAA